MGIFYKEWLESKWKLITGTVVFTVLSLLNVIMYPWIQTFMTPDMARLMESMMREMIPFIEMPALVPAFDSWNSYLYGSWISKTLYQSMIVYIILVASPLFAGEENKGTLEFLWSKPITTLKIVSAKYFVNVSELLIIVLVSTFILYPASLIIGEKFDASLFALGLVQAIPGFVMLFSIAFMMSTLFKDSIKAMVSSIILFSIMSVPSFLPEFRHLSIFRIFQGFNLLANESLMWSAILIFVFVSAVFFTLSYYVSSRKES